jgi:hypothetical protein
MSVANAVSITVARLARISVSNLARLSSFIPPWRGLTYKIEVHWQRQFGDAW